MNDENIQAMRKMLNGCLAAAIILLLLQFYYYCQPTSSVPAPASHVPADLNQLVTRIRDRLLHQVEATGFFTHWARGKWLALACLAIYLTGVRGRKDTRATWRSPLLMIAIGGICYFYPPPPLPDYIDGPPQHVHPVWSLLYICCTSAGFIAILTGGARISRILHSSLLDKDPFGRAQAGFPQEEQLIQGDYSINLPAVYKWQGKERPSWINIINPRRGILIIGSPGSGKSRFIIEPIIREMIGKGFALFLYDYKYPQLTNLAYRLFTQHRDRYPPSAAFYHINFSDLSRSHRCNVIAPSTLSWVSDAFGVSRTILLSMNRSWIHRQGEFFVESPITYLAAIIWFLRKYEDGRYCTLPHAIELAQAPYDKLFTVLNSEPEIRSLIQPFTDAYQSRVMDMLESQTASARIPLVRLASPDIYYILTGDDCSLDINDPAAPRILCLGGDPRRQEALGPVLSLYIDRLTRLVNVPGRYPCALVCDEFATVRAYSMAGTIATARSNNIVPVIAIQDMTQLRTQYSRDEADGFLNIAGNILCGQVGGETSQRVAERFPRVLQERQSVSTNSSDTSLSWSQQWEPSVCQATISALSSGEFLGIVTDDPDTPLELKAFHARLIRAAEEDAPTPEELPVVQEVDATAIRENFDRVRSEVSMIISEVMERMMSDEQLAGFVIQKP